MSLDNPLLSRQSQELVQHSAINAGDQESVWSKLAREGQLLGNGIKQGFGQGAEESAHDWWGTGARVLSTVGISVALGALTRGGGVGALLGKGIGTGFAVSFAYDALKPERMGAVWGAMKDTWNSPDHLKSNTDVISNQLGRFAFDATLMTAAGIGGAKLGEAFAAPKPVTLGMSLGAIDAGLDATKRSLPATSVFPDYDLQAPKAGKLLPEVRNRVSLEQLQEHEQVLWPRGEAKPLTWQPSETALSARLEAQNFVKDFMKEDYTGALKTAMESFGIHGVDLNPGARVTDLNIKAVEMLEPGLLQNHLKRMDGVGQFDWQQPMTSARTRSGETVNLPAGDQRLRTYVPRTLIEIQDGTPAVALVDFVPTNKGGYTITMPMTDVKGNTLTSSKALAMNEIRNSPEGQRIIAETALIAFEENIVHANQHLNGGAIMSPTYAAYTRDFGIMHGTRPSLLNFIGALDKLHETRQPFYEQEVPAMLYDAGMPLEMIQRHYFFGAHHVPVRVPIMNYLSNLDNPPTLH